MKRVLPPAAATSAVSSPLHPETKTALIGALTLLTAALALCFDGTRDGDLYLQLASGPFVAAHGVVNVDPFKTIAHGSPWLNQQWLCELLVYQLVALSASLD